MFERDAELVFPLQRRWERFGRKERSQRERRFAALERRDNFLFEFSDRYCACVGVS
jgi:hypothetical protein